MLPVWCRLWGLFLSTPSARRATFCGGAGGAGWRRATPMSRSICARRSKFLSTPSARRATYKRTELEPSMDISIHALREEGDGTHAAALMGA